MTKDPRPSPEAAGADQPILRIEGVSKSFGGIRAVQNLNLSVETGEVVAIIGPNGSGKTTFFNLLSGLYPVTSGSIEFDDPPSSLVGLPAHKINELGIARTFQTLRLFPNLTVAENVLIGMNRHLNGGFLQSLLRTPAIVEDEKKAEERATETLGFFGPRLLSMYNEPAYSLSYANRRRLEIARVLASRPKLILLDEPVAGMNPTETAEIMEDIKRINTMGFTVLLIEHDMALVRGVAERVIALDHGTKIAEGSFDDVCNDPEVIEAYLGRGAAAAGGAAPASDAPEARP